MWSKAFCVDKVVRILRGVEESGWSCMRRGSSGMERNDLEVRTCSREGTCHEVMQLALIRVVQNLLSGCPMELSNLIQSTSTTSDPGDRPCCLT
jgi:hypothetical protein